MASREELKSFIAHHVPAGAVMGEADPESLSSVSAGAFDAVVADERLAETADLPALLDELLRVLKHDGLLIIHAPNHLSVRRLLDAPKRAELEGLEEKKAKSFMRLFLRNIGAILSRTLSQQPRFTYYKSADGEVRACLNPLDLKFYLERKGAKICSYQELHGLPEAGIAKRLISCFAGEHMGLIRIVARKGARFERH